MHLNIPLLNRLLDVVFQRTFNMYFTQHKILLCEHGRCVTYLQDPHMIAKS